MKMSSIEKQHLENWPNRRHPRKRRRLPSKNHDGSYIRSEGGKFARKQWTIPSFIHIKITVDNSFFFFASPRPFFLSLSLLCINLLYIHRKSSNSTAAVLDPISRYDPGRTPKDVADKEKRSHCAFKKEPSLYILVGTWTTSSYLPRSSATVLSVSDFLLFYRQLQKKRGK